MIIMLPVKRPAEPRPAMARPRMKIIEVGATPQIVEPVSKITRKLIKVHFVEYSRYMRPQIGNKQAVASM
jgi:hypothetical protein